ncbi:MAG: recombinase family protein [Clostridiales bacterium]|jgi:DNA invertase Pin-like site-specific DNA recombinase|nr:recombinase family protein [Clostridiales bacterium]
MAQRIAIYSRKSKFTGKGESIENQIELCKQYIRVHYPDMAAENILVFEDEGFSGGDTERPQFKKMMSEAKTDGFIAVVCYRLDRVSRNIGDFAKLIEELEGLGVAFVSIRERFDTSSPMGRAMMYISSVFSQLERETIAERIRDNMRELSKTGRWLGGVTPTGYASESVERISVDGKKRKACQLILLPEEAGTVKKIFEVYLETRSLTKTEALLIRHGHRTKNGKYFSRFSLRNILTNPVYMVADKDAYRYLVEIGAELFSGEKDFNGEGGVTAYSRTVQKKGRANKIRPPEEWIVSAGKHRGLISGADWVKAQEYLRQNSAKSFWKPRGNPSREHSK